MPGEGIVIELGWKESNEQVRRMKLSIIIVAASVLIKFSTPGPGSYYLFSTADGGKTARIEASGYVELSSHVAATLPNCGGCKLFYVRFEAATNTETR
jgi:hypothetical protein